MHSAAEQVFHGIYSVFTPMDLNNGLRQTSRTRGQLAVCHGLDKPNIVLQDLQKTASDQCTSLLSERSSSVTLEHEIAAYGLKPSEISTEPLSKGTHPTFARANSKNEACVSCAGAGSISLGCWSRSSNQNFQSCIRFLQSKSLSLHDRPVAQAEIQKEPAPASPGVTIDEIFADDAVSAAYQPESVPARSTASSSMPMPQLCR